MNKPQPPYQMNSKIDENVGEGTYANFFVITNSASEFIMDLVLYFLVFQMLVFIAELFAPHNMQNNF